jgi:hypothetical protein
VLTVVFTLIMGSKALLGPAAAAVDQLILVNLWEEPA